MKTRIKWDYVNLACDTLVSYIKNDGKKFDVVVGIPRGGLVVAVRMSHLLNVPLKLDCFEGHVLLVDDICDSGRTMETEKNRILQCDSVKDVTTLVMNKGVKCKFKVDYYFQRTFSWTIYPWETEETSKVDYKDNEKLNEKLEVNV